MTGQPAPAPEPGAGAMIEIVGGDWDGDDREPYGTCRWCGKDNDDRAGLALIHEDGSEWYECGWCCRAIGEYELFDLVRAGDGDEIRLRAAELHEADDEFWSRLDEKDDR